MVIYSGRVMAVLGGRETCYFMHCLGSFHLVTRRWSEQVGE